MQVSMADFLGKVGRMRKTQPKIDALKANDSVVLRTILQSVFDPNIIWLLPEGIPPYKPNKLVDQEGVLISDIRYIKYFIKGFYDLPDAKRESMFIEFLERVCPEDAELLCSIKEKKLPTPGITLEQVIAALPGLIP